MKRTIFILIFFAVWCSAMAQGDFSRDVTLLSVQGPVIVVRSTAVSPEKKLAVPTAVKSAIDTYIFSGIDGVGDGKPVVDESARQENSYYFDRLYNQNRYAVFVKSAVEQDKPKKNSLGLWEVTVTDTIYRDALDRDLLQSKVRKQKTSEVTPEEVAESGVNPTIMVVPYKNDYETYRDVLTRDSDKRIAVGKVQEEFNDIGVETVDFEAKYDAALRANEMEYDTADSFDSQLIKNSGADIFVSVDIVKQVFQGGGSVALTLKAYQTSTGKLLSSKTSNFSGRVTFDRLCVGAIHKVAKEFLAGVVESLAKDITRGSTVVIRVGIDGESYKSLDDEVGNEEFGISDYIRSWVRKNAVNGRFHQQGRTSTSMILDQVQIPNTNKAGEPQDANDFAVRLSRYLRKIGVNNSSRLDGNTIYISITD